MSIVKELKNAEVKIEALQAERDEAVAKVEAMKAEQDASVAELVAKITAFDEVVSGLNATIVEKDAMIADKDQSIEALNVEKAAITDERDKAQKVLERPEFADLFAGQKAIEDGGEAGNQQVKTQAELLEEYGAIEDAGERAAFRDAHRKELGL